MHDLSETIRILLATAPEARSEAEARVRSTELQVHILGEIPVGEAPPDVIVVGATEWHATLSQLRAGFPFATRIILGAEDGPTLSHALRDGVHDVVGHDEPARSLARSLRLGAYRAQMEQRFAEISKRYRTAVHSAGQGVMRWDLSDRSMTFDPGWKAMLGYADDEHGDDSTAWFSRVHPVDQQALRSRLRATLDGATFRDGLAYRLQHRDGKWLWAKLRLEVEKIAPGHFILVGLQTDITVDKVSEQRVAWADRHDSLTGLLGRGAFVEELHDRILASETPIGVLGVCDLDGLRAVNSAYGRKAGDEVLLWLGGLFEDRLGEHGLGARLTGDKLAFLLLGATLDEAERLANILLEELQAEVFTTDKGVDFSITGFVIVAEQPEGAEDGQEWLGVANRCLERNRAEGVSVSRLSKRDATTACRSTVSLSLENQFS